MADYAWSLTDPGVSLLIGNIPGEITDTKDQIATRLNLEHTTIVTGTGPDDIGCLHKEGSAVVYYAAAASEPTTRPDGATALDSDDEGRLWVGSDDSVLRVYDGSDFQEVSIAGLVVTVAEGDGSTVVGDIVALLKGRTGGQTLLGGTDSDDALNLGGSSHTDEGPINVIAADTTLVELNDVPVWSLLLGEALNANSKKITGLDDAADSGDALALGAAVLTATELSVTGSVPRTAWAKTAVNADATLTIDVGFAPDMVVVWNDKSHGDHDMQFWMAGMGDNTKKAAGLMVADPAVTIAGQVLSFPNGKLGGNHTLASFFYYFAIKFNAVEQDAE